MTHSYLPDRAIIEVGGAEAEGFLDNLLTCKVIGLTTGEASFGALLSPQGKILYDFFLIKTENRFWLDTSAGTADELLKRLTFYRLRAKVDLVKLEAMTVVADFGDKKPDGAFVISDPRHPEMGWRTYGTQSVNDDVSQYIQQRISLCVPEGGHDFQYGDAYPHEVLMDQFGGVDFKKGCYVGQEVVSRMQHRGTAKKRVIKISSDVTLPANGTDILADGKIAGVVGSAAEMTGLALVRLDRIHEAEQIEADGQILQAELPNWVNFSWPEPR